MYSFGGDKGGSGGQNVVVERARLRLKMRLQKWLDFLAPWLLVRWCFFFFLLSVYLLRVYYGQGWYIITYGLGIYYLNQLIGFLSPQTDPELEGPSSLPTHQDDEFRPFIRRLPEYKFWISMSRATLTAFCCTLFRFLDIPVFWPILLIYFILLFVLTMRKRIEHMIKWKYLPFDFFGKKPKYKASARQPHHADALSNSSAQQPPKSQAFSQQSQMHSRNEPAPYPKRTAFHDANVTANAISTAATTSGHNTMQPQDLNVQRVQPETHEEIAANNNNNAQLTENQVTSSLPLNAVAAAPTITTKAPSPKSHAQQQQQQQQHLHQPQLATDTPLLPQDERRSQPQETGKPRGRMSPSQKKDPNDPTVESIKDD